MTIETIIPIKDGTYQVALDGEGNLRLATQIFHGVGYWVSDNSGVVIEGHITKHGLEDAFYLMGLEPGETVGIFTDPDTTVTYVDRSYHFIWKEVAIDFGNLYNQKYIYDNYMKEPIRL